VTDVLIVGAGSAGSILAERLSADPQCNVTVLEAGPGFDDPAVRVLTADGLTLPIGPDSPVARRYATTLTGDPPREAQIVRGVCAGGSGAINGGYFCRGLPGDVAALPGWSQAEVEHHHRAVERRIPVRAVDEFGSATTAFIRAAEHAGHVRLADLGRDGTGIAPVPLNIADGRRLGPGAVFLQPALGRPNLTVRSRTRATGIRFVAGRVVGVSAVGPDGPVDLPADRVVLAAGAIVSAQLLMLAGVGPAAPLRALGIPVIVDLPVGQRSWDHPELLLPTRRPLLEPADERRPVLEAVLVTPDLEVRPYTTGFGGPASHIGVALTRPRAHGTVSLASADPSAPPRIEHRYDSEPADLAALSHGCDLVRAMIEVGEPVWSTSQHLCGTAPMGEDTDEHAVVDPRCRVRGIDGLSVADGSVLARIPRRGPHATIAMVAHRAAEFIALR
jgi:predicted dehydrogenase (TIGR03970 family)